MVVYIKSSDSVEFKDAMTVCKNISSLNVYVHNAQQELGFTLYDLELVKEQALFLSGRIVKSKGHVLSQLCRLSNKPNLLERVFKGLAYRKRIRLLNKHSELDANANFLKNILSRYSKVFDPLSKELLDVKSAQNVANTLWVMYKNRLPFTAEDVNPVRSYLDLIHVDQKKKEIKGLLHAMAPILEATKRDISRIDIRKEKWTHL